MKQLRIGTSGYSFQDWRGPFYPEKIEKGKMLDFYVKHFPTVEINSTYYRIPHPAVTARITEKAPEGFDFMVKAPQSFTHKRTDLEADVTAYRECLQPMAESGKLSGVLAQFPYSFRFSPPALDYVARCRDMVTPHPLFVEFRHKGWVNRTMYDRLRSEQIGYVCVDEPELPNLLAPDAFATTNTGYIRLHGRNGEKWWNGGPLRYDYLYSPEQLEEWKLKVQKLLTKVQGLYVYFNNCHEGQAVSNAAQFAQMME